MTKVYANQWTRGYTQHVGKKFYFDVSWDVARYRFGIGWNTELPRIEIYFFRYGFYLGKC